MMKNRLIWKKIFRVDKQLVEWNWHKAGTDKKQRNSSTQICSIWSRGGGTLCSLRINCEWWVPFSELERIWWCWMWPIVRYTSYGGLDISWRWTRRLFGRSGKIPPRVIMIRETANLATHTRPGFDLSPRHGGLLWWHLSSTCSQESMKDDTCLRRDWPWACHKNRLMDDERMTVLWRILCVGYMRRERLTDIKSYPFEWRDNTADVASFGVFLWRVTGRLPNLWGRNDSSSAIWIS